MMPRGRLAPFVGKWAPVAVAGYFLGGLTLNIQLFQGAKMSLLATA